MNIIFRISPKMLHDVRRDLERPHAFAGERVGFLSCRCAALTEGGLLLLAEGYLPLADDDYLDNKLVGAMIGSAAIRKGLQHAYNRKSGLFHVHIHHHRGQPWFSKIDMEGNAGMVPDFFNAVPEMPHGALVLSTDAASGLCWLHKKGAPVPIAKCGVSGAPIQITWRDQ